MKGIIPMSISDLQVGMKFEDENKRYHEIAEINEDGITITYYHKDSTFTQYESVGLWLPGELYELIERMEQEKWKLILDNWKLIK